MRRSALLVFAISMHALLARVSARDWLPAGVFGTLSLLVLVLELVAILRSAAWAVASLVALLLLGLVVVIGNAASLCSPLRHPSPSAGSVLRAPA